MNLCSAPRCRSEARPKPNPGAFGAPSTAQRSWHGAPLRSDRNGHAASQWASHDYTSDPRAAIGRARHVRSHGTHPLHFQPAASTPSPPMEKINNTQKYGCTGTHKHAQPQHRHSTSTEPAQRRRSRLYHMNTSHTDRWETQHVRHLCHSHGLPTSDMTSVPCVKTPSDLSVLQKLRQTPSLLTAEESL